jgi:hypothetical protein
MDFRGVRDLILSVTCALAFNGLFYLTARGAFQRIGSEQKQQWIRRQNQVIWFVGAFVLSLVIGGIVGHVLEQTISIGSGAAGALAIGFGIAATGFFGVWMWNLLAAGRL